MTAIAAKRITPQWEAFHTASIQRAKRPTFELEAYRCKSSTTARSKFQPSPMEELESTQKTSFTLTCAPGKLAGRERMGSTSDSELW